MPPLEELFRAHAEDVLRIVTRLLGPRASEGDVDDLVQQVFLAADRARAKFRGEARLSSWLYGIATRVVLQHQRGRRRYRSMLERFEASPLLGRATGDLGAEVERRAALRRVWDVLDTMEPRRRMAFVLFELEGLTASEAATALGCSQEALRSRVRRARIELEQKWASQEKEGSA